MKRLACLILLAASTAAGQTLMPARQVTVVPDALTYAPELSNTVQAALEAIDAVVLAHKTADDLRQAEVIARLVTAEADIDAVEGRLEVVEGDITAAEARLDTAETDIDTLQALTIEAEYGGATPSATMADNTWTVSYPEPLQEGLLSHTLITRDSAPDFQTFTETGVFHVLKLGKTLSLGDLAISPGAEYFAFPATGRYLITGSIGAQLNAHTTAVGTSFKMYPTPGTVDEASFMRTFIQVVYPTPYPEGTWIKQSGSSVLYVYSTEQLYYFTLSIDDDGGEDPASVEVQFIDLSFIRIGDAEHE